MTTTPPRQGPRLTITGTCAGCPHLRTGVRDPRLGARLNAACVHPTRNDGGILFAKSSKAPTMPADCPLLPAARLALARSVVAEAERDEEAEEAAARKRSDDACEADPFAVDAAFDAETDRIAWEAQENAHAEANGLVTAPIEAVMVVPGAKATADEDSAAHGAGESERC